MHEDPTHCPLALLHLLTIDRGTSQNVIVVLANTVIVVSYLVIGKLYLHCLFHMIHVVSVPCCRQYPVSLSLSLASSPLFCRKKTEVELLHDPQCALSVFHSMCCPCFPSTSSNSTWAMHWNASERPSHSISSSEFRSDQFHTKPSCSEKQGCCSSVSSGDSIR